jgi:hypothetical protein
MSLKPGEFLPEKNKEYKVVPYLNRSKALTLTPDKRVVLQDYTEVASQKVRVTRDGGKYSFTFASVNLDLCIKDNGKKQGDVIAAVINKPFSCWFELLNSSHNGFIIKSFANWAIEVPESKA